jgi:type VI secretion system secreted protein VgrG
LLLSILLLAASVFMAGGTASASPTPVGLGAATSFAVHAGASNPGIANSVAGTKITGDAGLPDVFSHITGLVCANITGTIFATDGLLNGPAPCSATDAGTTVASDARTAFNHTSALSGPTLLPTDLSTVPAQTLVAGLYTFGGAATNLSTTLNLDAQGDPNAVWIFQASSTLITSSGSSITFVNAPAGSNLACNVFWTVGSSATISGAGANSTFVGTILASASITVNGPASGTATLVTGRLLAANQASGAGAVTIPGLATIIRPAGCSTLPAGTGGTPRVVTPVTGAPSLTG